MRCAVCPGKAVHQHHLIPRQVLKREGYKGRMDDPRNLIWLCWQCHMDHENWAGHGEKRLSRQQVPAEAWAFARELGDWAVVRMEEDYPVRGESPSSAGDVRA